MFDIATVGHFTIDSIFLPNRQSPFVMLGGSAAYVSLAAKRLEVRVSVISKVGSDFPESYRWWLEQEGIDLSNVTTAEGTHTTRFEIRYNADFSKRTLVLKNKTKPITVEDLPKQLKVGAIHIAPVLGEITYDVAEKLRNCTEILSLDTQGLVRNFDDNGAVINSSLEDKRVLGLIDIYKSSPEEIFAATDMSDLESAIKGVHDCGVKIVIVTSGAEGALISVENTMHKVPAFPTEKIVDPTGAGDAFMGGFLAEYVFGANLLQCACVGSAAASIVVEGVGPTFFGDKTEIYRRARLLYEKGIKE
jgi:sugar/nucleoside kinase (ribokinase family)